MCLQLGKRIFLFFPFTNLKNKGFWKRCEKKKMLVTSIFSFSHNVFYPYQIKFKFFSHICHLQMLLTHYQTTNFRLFQTERVCRRQFQIWRKWLKVIQTGRKHCGKRRNCSLRAISPFPSVFKRLVSQGRKKVSLCGNGLIWTSLRFYRLVKR